MSASEPTTLTARCTTCDEDVEIDDATAEDFGWWDIDDNQKTRLYLYEPCEQCRDDADELANKYGLTGQLRRVVSAAVARRDRVAMLTLAGRQAKPSRENEASIVIIRGGQEIEAFRRWARAQGLLTDEDPGLLQALEEPHA